MLKSVVTMVMEVIMVLLITNKVMEVIVVVVIMVHDGKSNIFYRI
jgi:hypothetical protein